MRNAEDHRCVFGIRLRRARFKRLTGVGLEHDMTDLRRFQNQVDLVLNRLWFDVPDRQRQHRHMGIGNLAHRHAEIYLRLAVGHPGLQAGEGERTQQRPAQRMLDQHVGDGAKGPGQHAATQGYFIS